MQELPADDSVSEAGAFEREGVFIRPRNISVILRQLRARKGHPQEAIGKSYE